ncbi:hypothetical protein NDK43_09155 [Neobacillus pocheonensis]|uniref:CbbX AAA lid domain-containing protein n=1 Tax=Neobacillus pocheonensis TaxID=363869 RepID=A0ABT0W870_9BACI|nr:hypothetical protein [Neobacillus pocheonensis]
MYYAGYPEEMRSFINANPGLRSRFPQSNFIQLPDYSNEELIKIAEQIAAENDYILTEESKIELHHRLDMERVDDTFGNARTVRNIILDAIFKKGSEISVQDRDILQFTLLNKDDFVVDKKKMSESATDQLNRLIGLDSLKEEMKSLATFVSMQQFRRKKDCQPFQYSCIQFLQATLVLEKRRLPKYMPSCFENVEF